MNTYYIIILFTHLTLFSCPSTNNDVNKGIVSEHVSNKDTLIIGKWTIRTYVINQATSTCYSCPQIQFLGNGTGRVKTPNNHEYKFKYSSIGDKLHINYKISGLSNLLCDSKEFFYEIKDEGVFLNLILNSKTSDCKFVLSKEK
jgi:hypothetical protein